MKTFVLSQIIYNMQSYGFKNAELINTERIIFKFLWSTDENPYGIDQVKPTIIKNDYLKVGMKFYDVESQDRSLKLHQFIRAYNSNYIISKSQEVLFSTKSGHGKCIHQESPVNSNNAENTFWTNCRKS